MGQRADVPVVKQKLGADPASVAFDTLQSAIANNADVVIIDTAGRLHNKKGLMDELTKVKNVMQKLVPEAPHEVLLVLDGSTGQNAFEQAKQFVAATKVSQLAITKLDGTAKGGVVIGISDQFKIPVRYIGLGEKITDLQVFDKDQFVKSLLIKIKRLYKLHITLLLSDLPVFFRLYSGHVATATLPSSQAKNPSDNPSQNRYHINLKQFLKN